MYVVAHEPKVREIVGQGRHEWGEGKKHVMWSEYNWKKAGYLKWSRIVEGLGNHAASVFDIDCSAAVDATLEDTWRARLLVTSRHSSTNKTTTFFIMEVFALFFIAVMGGCC